LPYLQKIKFFIFPLDRSNIGCPLKFSILDAKDEMPDQKAEDFGGDKRLREQPRFLSFEKIGPPYNRTFVLFVNDVVIQRQKLRAEAG